MITEHDYLKQKLDVLYQKSSVSIIQTSFPNTRFFYKHPS